MVGYEMRVIPHTMADQWVDPRAHSAEQLEEEGERFGNSWSEQKQISVNRERRRIGVVDALYPIVEWKDGHITGLWEKIWRMFNYPFVQ